MDNGVRPGVARLVIVDDHPAARQGLRLRLGREPDLLVLGEAATARDAVEEVTRLRPDVVLVDLCLPDGDGIELVQRLCSGMPGLRGVILTLKDAPAHRRRAAQGGVAAFVGKHEPTLVLLQAIRNAASIVWQREADRRSDHGRERLADALGPAQSANCPGNDGRNDSGDRG